MKISLSNYFPKGTAYFYAFPAGEDSSFFNGVPPWKEELVAARPLVCAGPGMRVVTFAAAVEQEVWNLLIELGLPLIDHKQIIILPSRISGSVKGRRRNAIIKKSLQNLKFRHNLVMAQPYLDAALHQSYKIPPESIIWCNDKKNLPAFIPAVHLPVRFATYLNGKQFADDKRKLPLPCVIKVSSSSSGDGVYICKTANALEAARSKFHRRKGTIIVEEFIDSSHNVCIQFGIPHNPRRPIEIFGYNEQLIDSNGEFLGAIIDPYKKIPALTAACKFLREEILPLIRKKGWYGIGGFDALITKDGKFYFIDANFRMTATVAYVCLRQNKFIKSGLVTFTGRFKGNAEAFREKILPLARRNRDQIIQIIALMKYKNDYYFNAGLLFTDYQQIKQRVDTLLHIGIDSSVLQRISKIVPRNFTVE